MGTVNRHKFIFSLVRNFLTELRKLYVWLFAENGTTFTGFSSPIKTREKKRREEKKKKKERKTKRNGVCTRA